MKSETNLGESLHIAFRAIRANKARGALTTLGIIIGIVAVVVTMTAANGLQNRFRESFSAVGSNVMGFRIRPPRRRGRGRRAG